MTGVNRILLKLKGEQTEISSNYSGVNRNFLKLQGAKFVMKV